MCVCVDWKRRRVLFFLSPDLSLSHSLGDDGHEKNKKNPNDHRLQGRDAREDSFRRCFLLSIRDAVPLSQSLTRSLSSVRDCVRACACVSAFFVQALHAPPFLDCFFSFDWNTRATRRVVPFPQKALRKRHTNLSRKKKKRRLTIAQASSREPRTLLVACLEDVRVLRRKLHFACIVVYRARSSRTVLLSFPITRHHAFSLSVLRKKKLASLSRPPIRLPFFFLPPNRAEVEKVYFFVRWPQESPPRTGGTGDAHVDPHFDATRTVSASSSFSDAFLVSKDWLNKIKSKRKSFLMMRSHRGGLEPLVGLFEGANI